jgi:hypothetical protein
LADEQGLFEENRTDGTQAGNLKAIKSSHFSKNGEEIGKV